MTNSCSRHIYTYLVFIYNFSVASKAMCIAGVWNRGRELINKKSGINLHIGISKDWTHLILVLIVRPQNVFTALHTRKSTLEGKFNFLMNFV